MVTLTDTGTTVVDEVTRRRRAEIARIVSRMSATTRKELVHALTAFATAGDELAISEQAGVPWV